MLDKSIFRAYDIRGVVGKTLDAKVVTAIGQAIGSLALERGERKMAIARDGRLSGPTLSAALSKGILSSGCDVIDIGSMPTPVLYYATHTLDTRSGVMLTGSHNPPDYNGLKIVVAGKTLAEADIEHLYERIVKNNLRHGHGHLTQADVRKKYIERIAQDVRLARPLKIVIDCGNGIAGAVAPALFHRLGCSVQELFCEVDGNFPNHHPDPSQMENLEDLIHAVKESKADIGLAFDGDGDRLGIVTPAGKVIWPDRQIMLFAKAILQKNPGAQIIFDVKCSQHLAKVITEFGGQPLMWKTGHSLIKSKLAETGAALAGEMSGHIFFKERWFGFDDGLYAGARLLEILAGQQHGIDELFNDIPDSINTPELKVDLADAEKFLFMEKLIKHAKFASAKLLTIDGLRADFVDGWGLVRPSNTTPCLVLRFEADNQKRLVEIQEMFRQQLLAVNPDLQLPF